MDVLAFFPSPPFTAFARLARAACAVSVMAAAPWLAGCESLRGYAPTFIQPYRPDVPQGNIVTREMSEQLRNGMTRDQVRFLLGTPLLADVFHGDRWDYVYHLKRGKGVEVQSRRLTVFFKNDRLDRWTADELPPETMADNLILGRHPKAQPKPPPPEPPPQITLPAPGNPK